MKLKKKKWWTYVPIINNTRGVCIVYGSKKRVKRVLKEYGYKPCQETKDLFWEGLAHAYTITQEGLHPVIALKSKPSTGTSIGFLAHEAVHAIDHIFKEIRETNSETNEIYAYSIQAIVEEGIKNLN